MTSLNRSVPYDIVVSLNWMDGGVSHSTGCYTKCQASDPKIHALSITPSGIAKVDGGCVIGDKRLEAITGKKSVEARR